MSLFAACRNSNLKSGLLAAAAALFMLATTSVHASPVTYDLTLTPGAGSTIGGSGSLTIATAPASSGISTYTVAAGNLDALSFSIDGQTFSLSGNNALVEFLNGTLYDITFAQELNSGTNNRYDLQTSGAYAFYYNNELSESAGTFSASVASAESPVPEPGSLALLATGLLGGAGSLYRRLRLAPSSR
jgi:hypothetical protein